MTPADAPKPPAFTLPRYVWYVWFPVAALLGWLNAVRGTGDIAFRSGSVAGTVVASLLFPLIASWIAWRLSRRQGPASAIVFLAVLALAALGQVVPPSGGSSGSRQLARDLERQTNQVRADLRQSAAGEQGITAEASKKALNQASASLQTIAEQAQGEERLQALGAQAFMQRAQKIQQRHADSIRGLDLATFFRLDGLEKASTRATRRESVKEFLAACADLRQFVEQGEKVFDEEMRRQGVSERGRRESLEGFRSSVSVQRMPLLLGIREKDEQLGRALADFIDFAEQQAGAWQKDEKSGQLAFTEADAAKRYNDFLATVQRLGNEQVALQRQLLAP